MSYLTVPASGNGRYNYTGRMVYDGILFAIGNVFSVCPGCIFQSLLGQYCLTQKRTNSSLQIHLFHSPAVCIRQGMDK